MSGPAAARALLVAALLAPASAGAACNVSATGVAFGIYNPASATPAAATGAVTLTCGLLSGLGVASQFALGVGGGGSYSARRMASGGGTLQYQLYLDAARTQIWGDGSGGTSVNSDLSLVAVLGGSVSFQVYGLIPARQSVAPGAYVDVIVVTVTY